MASRPIEEEIGMLLDCSSFALILEKYSGDSLVEKRITKSFYNYGNKRYSFQHELNPPYELQRVLTLQILNDTFSIQTRLILDPDEERLDSTLIYSREGNIVKVVFKENGKLRRSIQLEYNRNMIVRKTYDDVAFGKTTVYFKYRNGKMVLSKLKDFKDQIIVRKFNYTDSLITVTELRNEAYLKTVKQIIQIDKLGNLISESEYNLTSESPEFVLVKKTQYDYTEFNTILETVENLEGNSITTTRIEQNEIKTIRTVWKDKNVTSIRTYEYL